MSFNLRAKRKRPLERLRSLSEDCAELRPSDLDGMSEKDMHHFFYTVRKASLDKEALHGRGETWSPVGSDFSPYRTSPLVNYQGPEFGGRWRKEMPGSGDQHINDDSDKSKSGKGDASNDDFNPQMQKERINDLLNQIKGPAYVVRMTLMEEDEPSEGRAKEMFGVDGQTDGKSVYVIVNGFEEAQKVQRRMPGSIIEPKG